MLKAGGLGRDREHCKPKELLARPNLLFAPLLVFFSDCFNTSVSIDTEVMVYSS